MDEVLSRLSLGRLLGAGHFGEVYEGSHHVHGPIAVKKFQRLPGEDEDVWRERADGLLAEGKSLKAAEHERVVRVLDVTYSGTEEAIYLLLELCPGGSLQALFERGPTPLLTLRRHLTEVAMGIQVVHARGLIHRDIKPANILRDADGRAKVSDFGLVTDRLVVGYASGMGYVDHLAPEVFSSDRTSIRTDVWAFGMTAYRLLHGLAFYEELPPPRDRIQRGGYARGLPWLPHVPDKWRRFIRKAMHDDSSARLQDFGEVLSWLAELPTTPDWHCEYSPQQVTWSRTKDERRIVVTWLRHSPRSHEWSAISSPVGATGRARTLAKSATSLSKSTAIEELEAFFSKSS